MQDKSWHSHLTTKSIQSYGWLFLHLKVEELKNFYGAIINTITIKRINLKPPNSIRSVSFTGMQSLAATYTIQGEMEYQHPWGYTHNTHVEAMQMLKS